PFALVARTRNQYVTPPARPVALALVVFGPNAVELKPAENVLFVARSRTKPDSELLLSVQIRSICVGDMDVACKFDGAGNCGRAEAAADRELCPAVFTAVTW